VITARTIPGVVLDAHHDIYELNALRRRGVEHPLASVLVPKWRKAGLDMLVFAIGGDSQLHANYADQPLRGTLENLDGLRQEIAAAGEVRLIRHREDLPTAPGGPFALMLTLEGGRPIEGSLGLLRTLFELGLRMMQPVWNYRNELGDGAMEARTGGGLSQAGVAVIQEVNRLGIVLDVAHFAPSGFWQVLEINRGPLVCSHANAAAVTPHPRNLADDQIRAVASTGGVVGLQHSPGRVHATEPTLERLLDHLDHMARVAGIEHVGIGLDLAGKTGSRPPKDERFATTEPKALIGFETVEEFPNLIEGILRRGYKPADASKILGGNFLRVFNHVIPSRTA